MKGRLSNKWGHAQSAYYIFNLDTRDKKYLIRKAWSKATIQLLLDMSLEMSDDHYIFQYGRTKDEQRKKKIDIIISRYSDALISTK